MADGLLSNRGQSILDLDRRSFLMAMDELGISGADRDNLLRRYREQASPFSGVYGASREAQEDIAARGRRPVAFGLLSAPAEATGWDAVRGLRPEFMSSALGLLEGVGKGIDAPASAGLIPASDAPMEALGTVGMAALGSMPARVPEGALRIFGGPWARTADLNALDRAKQMEAEGTDRGMIWGQTGWYRGGDGKWRFEIGDEATGLEPTAYRDLLRNYSAIGEMGDLFRANDLYQAYPDLARINTRIENTRGSAPSSGKYFPPRSREYFGLFDITEEISARGGVEPGVSYGGRPARLERYLPQRSTLLHELQHAVQERENFARGTSPMYSSGVPREEAFAAYRAAPGEIEARNVQERADMPGLLRRMVAPWETADMPETQPPQFESVVASSNPIMRAPDAVSDRGDQILGLLRAGRGQEVTDEMLDMGDPVLNTRLNEYLYRNYDLPMDPDSRMARAREMGFDAETPLYHGTDANIFAFDDSPPYRRINDDAGVFFADKPSAADGYGNNLIPAFRKDGVPTREVDLGAPREVFDMIPDDQKPWSGTFADYRNTPGYGAGELRPRDDFAGVFSDYINSGWDVRYSRVNDVPGDGRKGRHAIVQVADPANIRSRFARFDPRLAHLRNLSAGIGALGLLNVPSDEELRLRLSTYLNGG